MKGAARRWMFASLAALWIVGTAGTVLAAAAEVKVTDRDRTFRNFTRDAAVIDDGQFRIELRGMHLEEDSAKNDPNTPGRCQSPLNENCTRLDIGGRRVLGVEQLNGGLLELVASYGIGGNVEVGGILPGIFETVHRDDGTSDSAQDLGDMTLYGKFKYLIEDVVSVAGGLELTLPTGDDDKITTVTTAAHPQIQHGTASGFGTGTLGINPVISARYTWKQIGVQTHVGYNFYTDSEVEQFFNWSATGFVRGGESWAFRAEFNGRVFDQFGTTWVDVNCFPGIDYYLSDSIVFRPTGMANITGTSLDWGIGTGISATF